MFKSHLRFRWCAGLVRYSLQLSKDLLHPSADEERRKHKLKRLVQSPNSYFMDVKCPGLPPYLWSHTLTLSLPPSLTPSLPPPPPPSPFVLPLSFSLPFSQGCYKITTVFSHAQTVVLCVSCSTVLCQPTGGRARLTEGLLPTYNLHKLLLFCRLLP